MGDPGREVETQAFARVLAEELQRRLREVDAYVDPTFGMLGPVDMAVIGVTCFALPLALIWLMA